MAYIDREKVLKAVEKMDRLDKETKTKYEYDKEGFLLLINSAPTADVEEVVRCGNCRNCIWIGVHYCNHFERNVDEDDYCSYGSD